MVDDRIVREWVDKASEDFAFALVNLQEGKPFFSQICFHFHQSAEKYLKACIVAWGLEFRKIHDLVLLQKICNAREPAAEELRDACAFLTAFYVDTRYPVHGPTHYSSEEAQRAYHSAEIVKQWVERQFPSSPKS
jgi:HEPN domain-containing protein